MSSDQFKMGLSRNSLTANNFLRHLLLRPLLSYFCYFFLVVVVDGDQIVQGEESLEDLAKQILSKTHALVLTRAT